MNSLRDALQVPFFDLGTLEMFDPTLVPSLPRASGIVRKWICYILFAPQPQNTPSPSESLSYSTRMRSIPSAATLSFILDALRRYSRTPEPLRRTPQNTSDDPHHSSFLPILTDRFERYTYLHQVRFDSFPGCLIYLQYVSSPNIGHSHRHPRLYPNTQVHR